MKYRFQAGDEPEWLDIVADSLSEAKEKFFRSKQLTIRSPDGDVVSDYTKKTALRCLEHGDTPLCYLIQGVHFDARLEV